MKEKWQLAIFAAAVSLAASAAPSRIADTSWIKPGKVLRVAKLSEACGKDCVDFAVRNDIPYIELDAGWYDPERSGDPMKPNAHDCALPFTRFLDGPGDYTPCWNQARVKNTLAHQLALPCVYTSGWQFLFWYSRPDQIDDKDPALDFWREIPCAFDETRFLQGKIGEYAVSARRMKSGDVFSVDAAARGGFALIVEKAKTGQ